MKDTQITAPGQKDGGGDEWFKRMTNWKHDATGSFGPWLKAMRAWRREQLARMNYDGSQYLREDLAWTQRDFIQPQSMVEERYLYDPATRKYTVDRFLDDLDRRYGGIDSVLLWPVYPNIGIDNRNQWDLLRDMPGGTPALKAMVGDFHRRGVRVLFPTMPWDNGTRDVGMTHSQATARLMAEIGVDGINGDTCSGLPLEFRRDSDAAGNPLALEPELAPSDDAMLAYNQQSWAYWDFPFVPMVSRLKWLEPRHMLNVCARWDTDHTNVMQFAFFNGVGIESWENVWGFWNGFTPRDSEAPAADIHDLPCGSGPCRERNMDAGRPDAALRHLCEQLPRAGEGALDDRQPERLRRQRGDNLGPPCRLPFLRPLERHRAHPFHSG